MKNKVTLLNMLSGLFLQIAIVVSGFIVPKIILTYFGSSVNGLVSSINQFLNYIALLEGGVTGVIYANLYKAITSGDTGKISSILMTSKKFFRKIGIIFLLYVLVLAVIYPILFAKDYDYFYVLLLIIVLSINLSVQYLFSLTWKSLFIADKKGYIVNFTQIFITLLNIGLAFLSVIVYPSIHFLKLLTGLLFFLQPIVYKHFGRKYYEIDKSAKGDNKLLSERWNGFAVNLAAFIHSCTDVTLLTLFSTFEMVSVYCVYSLVTTGLKNLVNSITSGINPTIGHAYARNDFEELNKKMDLYEYVVFVIVFFIFSIAGLLITPFVLIYTSDVKDTDYNQPIFGILLIISELLYLIKTPHLNLSYSANMFKRITIPAFVEAAINIVLSIILIQFLGIIGIAIGTLVAMLYRMIYHVYLTSKIIPDRKQILFYKKMFLFTSASIIGWVICLVFMPVNDYSIFEWIIKAIEYIVVFGFLYIGVSFVFFKDEMRYVITYLKKKN